MSENNRKKFNECSERLEYFNKDRLNHYVLYERNKFRIIEKDSWYKLGDYKYANIVGNEMAE